MADGEVRGAGRDGLRVAVLARYEVGPQAPEFVLSRPCPRVIAARWRSTLAPSGVDVSSRGRVALRVPLARRPGGEGRRQWRSAADAARSSPAVRTSPVTVFMTTREVCGLLAETDLALVLHEQADCPWPSWTSAGPLRRRRRGAEGGLDDGEVVAFRAAGAHAVRLGAEVLRTSTCGAAALAALSMSALVLWRAVRRSRPRGPRLAPAPTRAGRDGLDVVR